MSFLKPLVKSSGSIETLVSGDILGHGDFPVWSENKIAWKQTQLAFCSRAGLNRSVSKQIASTLSSLGSDSGKWSGLVLATNGYIYGMPHNSTAILKIDPGTDTATTFGNIGSGSSDWVGGVLASNGSIYGIPYNSTSILKIDPTTDSYTTFGDISGSTKWFGAVMSPDGYIYCIPFSYQSILKINPATDTYTTFGNINGSSKWAGGVLAPNGMIYAAPYYRNDVLKIDPSADTISLVGADVYCKVITISNAHVSSDLTNFPACVKIINDADIGVKCLSDGSDIFFMDENHNILDAECDSFTISDGVANGTFWVKIPTIYSANSTVIYCCYDGQVSKSRNETNVWDSNFTTVYHFGDGTTLSVADSTLNANNSTNYGATVTTGMVGGAAAVNGGYLTTPRSISTDWTISFWFYAAAAGSSGDSWYAGSGLIDGETAGFVNDFGSSFNGYTVAFGVGNPDTTIKTANLSLNTWYRASLTRVSSTGVMKIFINGSVAASNSSGPTGAKTIPPTLAIGRIQPGYGYFNGIIDEIQFSNIVRSDAWIEFDYYNQNSSSDLTWSAETTAKSIYGDTSEMYVGGVLSPGGSIYYMPYSSQTILKIDPTTDVVTTFGSLSGTSKYSGGVLAPDGYIYGIPHDSTTVLKIDPITDAIISFDSLTGSGKWVGGVISNDGSPYCAPYTSENVLKLCDSFDDVQTNFCLSRYFNKL